MAIRPVDLQLAYLAGPQNAAVVSHSQNAPQAAQQAAQSAFAAEVVKREESIAEPEKVDGQKVRARDGDSRDERGGHSGQQRRDAQSGNPHGEPPAEFGNGDHHFIDVTV